MKRFFPQTVQPCRKEWETEAALHFAEKVASTATLGCARLVKWQKTEHRQECLCYKNASEMDFFRKLFSR
jgi:hypothetical protein